MKKLNWNKVLDVLCIPTGIILLLAMNDNIGLLLLSKIVAVLVLLCSPFARKVLIDFYTYAEPTTNDKPIIYVEKDGPTIKCSYRSKES